MRLSKGIKKKICSTKGCRKRCVGKFCSTCRSRTTRAKDLIKYTFYNIRNRAKQRSKEFTITLVEFRQWCIDNDFIPGNGYSIDRIRNWEGYHINNIQKMKLIDNINKYHHHDKYQPTITTDENPF